MVKGERLRWFCGLVLAAETAFLGVSCTATSPRPEPLKTGPSEESVDSLALDRFPPVEEAEISSDSLYALGEALIDAGAFDGSDGGGSLVAPSGSMEEGGQTGVPEPEDPLSVGIVGPSPGPSAVRGQAGESDAPSRGRLAGFDYRVQVIAGPRSDARIRLDAPRGFVLGLRQEASRKVLGYVRFEGSGFVRAVHAGQLTVRVGERLILGRGIGSYGSSTSGPVRRGFAMSPSLSEWSGRPGLGLDLAWGGWRCESVLTAPSLDEGGWHPDIFWGTAGRDLDGGNFGVTYGRLVPGLQGESPQGKVPGEGSNRRASPGWMAMLHGAYRRGRFAGSGEIAGVEPSGTYGAIRFTQGGPRPGSAWRALIFRAPCDSPVGNGGFQPVFKIDQGMRLDFSSLLGRAKASIAVEAGKTWSASTESRYRRLSLALDGQSGSMSWDVSAVVKERAQARYPTHPAVHTIPLEGGRELRIRATLLARGGTTLRSAVRAECAPGGDEKWRSLILFLWTEVVGRRAEVRVQVAGHALDSGRQTLLWRPGLGPFEWFGPLYGAGSDFSLRCRFAMTSGARVVLFYGSTGRGGERLYAGVELQP